MQADGPSRLQKGLNENRQRCAEEITEGLICQFQALDDMQERGRQAMLKFFYGGCSQMSVETYEQKAPEIHESSSSREVTVRSMVDTVQSRALKLCRQREEAGRDLPASEIVIFVLPGLLHEGPRVANLIKERQKELSSWKQKGKILLAGTDRKFDDKTSDASLYYSSRARGQARSLPQIPAVQPHPGSNPKQEALSASPTNPPAYGSDAF
ncbi:hypothetical protein LTR70_009488 [Exophiala xenobiotica]|uniref:Uncharacterized protein n=1 Tax=Lithohypha guttulata TaxID=1690604 RepID=A0ABR0JX57_9EURO|nr:hypothetical protein LTR24_009384 [Lithohypha guttulata]KAK5310420.1 hypothetical protein LTR70_009488 [Exophiala xenobiotica]